MNFAVARKILGNAGVGDVFNIDKRCQSIRIQLEASGIVGEIQRAARCQSIDTQANEFDV